ncbi:MAG: hypothetical protein M3O09_15495 [Acidobacteriota bacterium]|nr:hypothetical protein [Acidobacteriota bacterium]
MDLIANEFQNKLLSYRVNNYGKLNFANPAVSENLHHHTQELAMILASCVFDDSELALAVYPLLQQQSDSARGNQDSEFVSAIAEVLVANLHKKDTVRVFVKPLTESVNTILTARGEIVEFSREDVGRKLRNLGIFTKRSGAGKYVLLCREISLLAHRLARTYDVPSLVNAVHGCPDCAAAQALEKRPPVHDVNEMHVKLTRSKT